MSFLITGANGLIGHDLIKILSKNKKIIAIQRKKKNNKLKNKNIIWIKHDLTFQLNEKFKFKPKYIINCALDEKFQNVNSKKYLENNISIIKNIINCAKKYKVDLIINLSSIDIYGKPGKNILKENTQPKKQSDYGKLKYLSERMIANSNLNYLNLRIPGTLCSKSITTPNRPWINQIINNFLKNKKVTIYNPGSKFNNITSSLEIVRFIKYVTKRKLYNNTFNFATKESIRIDHLVNSIKNIVKSKSFVKKINSSKNKPFLISINKLEKKTQFRISSTQKVIKNYIYNNIKK